MAAEELPQIVVAATPDCLEKETTDSPEQETTAALMEKETTAALGKETTESLEKETAASFVEKEVDMTAEELPTIVATPTEVLVIEPAASSPRRLYSKVASMAKAPTSDPAKSSTRGAMKRSQHRIFPPSPPLTPPPWQAIRAADQAADTVDSLSCSEATSVAEAHSAPRELADAKGTAKADSEDEDGFKRVKRKKMAKAPADRQSAVQAPAIKGQVTAPTIESKKTTVKAESQQLEETQKRSEKPKQVKQVDIKTAKSVNAFSKLPDEGEELPDPVEKPIVTKAMRKRMKKQKNKRRADPTPEIHQEQQKEEKEKAQEPPSQPELQSAAAGRRVTVRQAVAMVMMLLVAAMIALQLLSTCVI